MSNHKQVLIAGRFDPWIANLFYEREWRGTKDLAQADLVVFTGGEDINPELYHEKAIDGVHFNPKRDEMEKAVFQNARNLGTPMVGICRGAQLLNVLCGGRLWQHVDNHTQSHYLTDIITNEVTLVTSTHHQQMRPHPVGVVVARAGGNVASPASLCTVKMAEGVQMKLKGGLAAPPFIANVDSVDTEVVWYPADQALCFQPHPEIPNAHSTRSYFWSVMDRYITPIVTEGMAA